MSSAFVAVAALALARQRERPRALSQAVGLAHCGFSIAYSTYNQSSKVRWAGCS